MKQEFGYVHFSPKKIFPQIFPSSLHLLPPPSDSHPPATHKHRRPPATTATHRQLISISSNRTAPTECEKKTDKKGKRLLEEPLWRTYCNGKKCGFAMRRECGPEDWKVLKAVEPISMGAGVESSERFARNLVKID
jgi:hypothetical protein